jgi:predicted dehydrogenase
MMAENYCYRKESMLIKSMAEQGAFGELYFGEGEYVHELKALNERTRWRRRWQTGRNGNTYPTHSLGPVLQWMRDQIVRVTCLGSGNHYRDPRGALYENEDTTLTLCKLSRGGLVKLRLDMLSERPHNITYYSLQGTKGCFEAVRGLGDVAKVWLADYCPDRNAWKPLSDFEAEFLPPLWRHPPDEAVRAGHGGGDYFQVRDFVDSILNDTPPPIGIHEALEFTVPGLVSEESIHQDGAPLPVPDFRALQRYPEDLPAELRGSRILRVRE